MRRSHCPPTAGVTLILAALVAGGVPAAAQAPADTARVSVVYTGRSLGALGVRRAQDEHELLREQANAEHVPFKLVSHMAWRAPGLVILFPGQEPTGSELPFVLAERANAERIEAHHPDVPLMRGDFTDDDVLIRAGVRRAAGVVGRPTIRCRSTTTPARW